jgi:hypothetical protein
VAIPVDNAPPPYRPPERRAPNPEDVRDIPIEALRRGPLPGGPNVRQVQVRVGRGCGLAALFSVASLCALSGVLVWMLVEFAGHEYGAQAGRIAAVLRETARAEGRESTVDADLRAFDALLAEERVGIVATAALVQRHALAKQDGRIDPAELDRMMEVVHDAVIHEGSVDPARYPELQNPTF